MRRNRDNDDDNDDQGSSPAAGDNNNNNNNDDDDTGSTDRRPRQRLRILDEDEVSNGGLVDGDNDSPNDSPNDNNSNNNHRSIRAERMSQLAERRRREQQQEQQEDPDTEVVEREENSQVRFVSEHPNQQRRRSPTNNRQRHRRRQPTDDDDDDRLSGLDTDNDDNASETDLLTGEDLGDMDGDVDDDNMDGDDEEEEGEDLLENMQRDYQPIAALDTYGTEGIDDTDYDVLDVEQREAAERELRRLDRERFARVGTSRRSDGFYGLLDQVANEEQDREDDEARLIRRGMFRGRRSNKQRRRDGHDDSSSRGSSGDEDGRRGTAANVEDDDDDETDEEILDGEDTVNLEAFDVPLREWIAQDRTRREIQRRFRKFLRHFTPTAPISTSNTATMNTTGTSAAAAAATIEVPTLNNNNYRRQRKGNGLYEQKIRALCAANLATLQVSYVHFMEYEPILAYWLADAPQDMFLVLNEAATRHTLMLFPSYYTIQNEIHVRITDVPIMDSLRDLRRSHLNCLVKVSGVVTRRSSVFPQLQIAYYTCLTCKKNQGPYRIYGTTHTATVNELHQPDSCPHCDVQQQLNQNNDETFTRRGVTAAAFRLHPTLSQYRNMQRLNLQEAPGSVPPGRVPRTKEVLLMDDLIDTVRPGEEAEITGVYEHTFDSSLTLKSGFPVFSTSITANHIRKREDVSSAANLSEQDVRQILELARDPKIGDRIVRSIAPSIYGHEFCKMALAMSLFAGVPKNMQENKQQRIRGDINVLLLGDPGTAKSQLLKYAQNTAPRAVYSTGKGASAVGLTASVHKDPITREWTLEGGALVLADKGVCLIDEFDKMNEQDRTSIHEAMEQQSISVSKAGIVTSLQARCSVIAAANPIGGRYDSSHTLSDNVELTDPILQRFDILCVLQDTVDPIHDERLAKFVTDSHMRSTPTSELQQQVSSGAAAVTPPPPQQQQQQQHSTSENQNSSQQDLIPQELLRKYIQYARTNVRPILRNNTFDQEKVASLYVALRRESATSGGVPVAVRHVESIMRMSEAYAKMHLRDYVRDDDVNVAIQMLLRSFIDSQKFSVQRSLRRHFNKYITSNMDRAYLLLHILQDMFRKEEMYQIIRRRQQQQQQQQSSQHHYTDMNDDDETTLLEIPFDEFASKARERRIYDVSDFCTNTNTVFTEAGYQYNEEHETILFRRGSTTA